MIPKRTIFSVLLIVALVAVGLSQEKGPDFNGTWTAAIETQVGVQNYTFTFKVDGAKVTGKAKSAFASAETDITEGVIKADEISFIENLNYEGMPLRITYKGKISGDEIKFTRNVAEIADEPFVAKRSK